MSDLLRARARVLFAVLLILPGALALAQGVQTGTISGVVQSVDHVPLPGVTVTAASSALQGERTTVSDANGVFYLRGLGPGAYRVTFTLQGFQTAVEESVAVTAGGVVPVDAQLSPARVTADVNVQASAITSPVTSQTYRKREIDLLPVGRRPLEIAELAPGVTTNVFNNAQLTVAGSFGYDNVFLLNGVDVDDNIFGTANNLYIEDAIQETTVLTHGIPAEYGRFSGGVINVVTQSGGNRFSGSFRDTVSNPSWIEETPLQRATGGKNPDLLSQSYEGTFGGPVVKDRLWFFTAGRYEKANIANTLGQGGAGYVRTDTNRRGEIKLTATVAPNQTLQGTYINNATKQANAFQFPAALAVDPKVLISRTLPNRSLALTYTGTVRSSLFATLQYSEKKQGFRGNGGTSNRLADSPFQTFGSANIPGGLYYHAPYLDATDPENRDNHQVSGSLSYLLTTPRWGSHELKGGGEYFVSTGIGGNSQSSTGYVVVTDYLTDANGQMVRDAAGSPIPVFTPGQTQVWSYLATKGATIDLKTTSLYFQDRWIATPRLTFNLGVRAEVVRGDATGDIIAADTSSVVPRLAATYDIDGTGTTVLTATYGHYAGKYTQVQFGAHTNVGRPNEIDYDYAGPAGQGADFAPAFDLANYTSIAFAGFPTANVKLADGLRAPLTKEFTVGVGRQLGAKADAKVTYAWRTASDFIEDFLDLKGGIVDVPLVGPLTNRVYRNTNALHRDYQAVIAQGSYHPRRDVVINAHYTLQLQNEGDFSGEAAGQPGTSSVYGDFPEIFGLALGRLQPSGRLDNYQRHKLRVLGLYSQSLGQYGALDLSPIWRVNSGGVYSLTSPLRVPAAQLSRNPGYPVVDINGSLRELVYYGDRGQYDFKGYGVMDFAASYHVAAWRSVQPWVKLEIYNVFNNQKLISWDRTVTGDLATIGANGLPIVDANGIPTGYIKGSNFGKATSGTNFPQPYPGQNGGRAIRAAFGLRF